MPALSPKQLRLYDIGMSLRTNRSRRPSGGSSTYGLPSSGAASAALTEIINAVRSVAYKPRIRGQLMPLIQWYVNTINRIIPEVVTSSSRTQDTTGQLANTTKVMISGESGAGSIDWDLKIQSAARYARVLEVGREESFGTPWVEWLGGGKKNRFRIGGSQQHDYWVPLPGAGARAGESIQQMRDRMPHTFIIPKVYNNKYLVVFDRGAAYQRKGYKGRTPGSKNRGLGVKKRDFMPPPDDARGPVFAIYVGMPRVVPTRWFTRTVQQANAAFVSHVAAEGGAYAKRILGPIFG